MASFQRIRSAMGQWIMWALFAAIWGWLVFGQGFGWLASLPAALIGTVVLMVPVILLVAFFWRLTEDLIAVIRGD